MSRVNGRYLLMMALQSLPLWLVTIPWSQALFYVALSRPPAPVLTLLTVLPLMALATFCWHWDR
jgi:hypothetical protein